MVAFSTADLPATINTVEKLHVWSTMVLQNLVPTATTVETSGASQLIMTASPYFITASDPQQWRFIGRCSIPVAADWQKGTQKFWVHAQAISTAAIPTDFKS